LQHALPTRPSSDLHLAAKHVDQLRQLIQRATQVLADARDSLIGRIDAGRPIGVVVNRRRMHRTELQESERSTVTSEALLREKYAPLTVEPNRGGDREHQWSANRESSGSNAVVERALDRIPKSHVSLAASSSRSYASLTMFTDLSRE